MGKRMLYLPKEINGLLEEGNVEELKRLFARCEPNALCSRGYKIRSSNIFSLSPLPREFAVWAKEQGADVNLLDGCGFTPVFDHAGAVHGDVRLLIELGAKTDIIMCDGTTPLHEAAVHGRMDNMIALLENGAKVDAGMGLTWGTPLESAVRQDCLSFDTLLEVCTLLLEHGAEITDRVRRSVWAAGVRAGKAAKKAAKEGRAAKFNEQQLAALERLYDLFQVDATEEGDLAERPLYTFRGLFQRNFRQHFDLLWKYLVYERGKAATAQGEVIRIIGRMEHEMLDNGSMNWDEDFRKMLRMLPQYFRLGNPVNAREKEYIEAYIDTILPCGEGEKEIRHLGWYAINWVQHNAQLIQPLPANYSR